MSDETPTMMSPAMVAAVRETNRELTEFIGRRFDRAMMDALCGREPAPMPRRHDDYPEQGDTLERVEHGDDGYVGWHFRGEDGERTHVALAFSPGETPNDVANKLHRLANSITRNPY